MGSEKARLADDTVARLLSAGSALVQHSSLLDRLMNNSDDPRRIPMRWRQLRRSLPQILILLG